MNKSWAGPAITGLIVVGIGLFLFLNFQPGGDAANPPADDKAVAKASDKGGAAEPAPALGAMAVREYPIGDEVEKNHMTVNAVWLPAVMMDGMSAAPDAHPVHIEADIKAAGDNPHGFAKDEKVPYLKIAYSIVAESGGEPVAKGELLPMVARDGFHYGATVDLPKAGRYRLVYDIQPPSAGGLGRHSDPATGVAPWWEPFQAQFDWTVEPDAAAAVTLR